MTVVIVIRLGYRDQNHEYKYEVALLSTPHMIRRGPSAGRPFCVSTTMILQNIKNYDFFRDDQEPYEWLRLTKS